MRKKIAYIILILLTLAIIFVFEILPIIYKEWDTVLILNILFFIPPIVAFAIRELTKMEYYDPKLKEWIDLNDL